MSRNIGNVLSLFDGMSCGQIALNRAGIKYDKYYASEIKSHAIKVTQHNYPDTIQLGDIRDIKAADLPKIDLLIGGSPCQDFSRGNAVRDGLEGVKSSLFYEYLRLLKDLSPSYWLLENVVMDAEQEMIISELMGTEPVRINSSLVSAQLRDRLYWTNIGPESFDLFGNRTCCIPLPKDRKIKLQDILESGFADREKSRALLESDSRPLRTLEKMWHRYDSTGFTTVVFESPDLDWKKGLRYLNQTELERLQTVPEGYTSLLKRNDAACLLGDGWTVDVIAHIFSFM
ncbi:C-5 cytosine-specific DNA methylase [anaerobic digester metagenome]